jgi:hypothetical protein
LTPWFPRPTGQTSSSEACRGSRVRSRFEPAGAILGTRLFPHSFPRCSFPSDGRSGKSTRSGVFRRRHARRAKPLKPRQFMPALMAGNPSSSYLSRVERARRVVVESLWRSWLGSAEFRGDRADSAASGSVPVGRTEETRKNETQKKRTARSSVLVERRQTRQRTPAPFRRRKSGGVKDAHRTASSHRRRAKG